MAPAPRPPPARAADVGKAGPARGRAPRRPRMTARGKCDAHRAPLAASLLTMIGAAAALPTATSCAAAAGPQALSAGVAGLQSAEGRTYALYMSLFAGLATSIGGIIAVVQRPDDAKLAFLLGVAIGVMASLSIVELLINNAIEHGALGVAASCFLGAVFFAIVEPLLPEAPEVPEFFQEDSAAETAAVSAGAATTAGGADPPGALVRRANGADASGLSCSPSACYDDASAKSLPPLAKRAQLLRLGFLMAVTMTLHNLPEGFAVAFASHAEYGTAVTLAVAVHNIPEGVIVAAPIFTATGSRTKALAIATLSGLSEPFGALIALNLLHAHLTELRLAYLLAFTGGVMGAVCVLELWPEGKRCRHDAQMFRGIGAGVVLMLLTLWAGA